MTRRMYASLLRRPILAITTAVLLVLACSRTTATPYTPFVPTDTQTPLPYTPTPSPTATPSPTDEPTPRPTPTHVPTWTYAPTATRGVSTPIPLLYYAQAGDTLHTLAVRFAVLPGDILSADAGELPAPEGLLRPGMRLLIPQVLESTTSADHLFPDSAVVYSGVLAHFDVNAYVREQGGYLSGNVSHRGGSAFGGELLRQIAFNNSFSPKLLLALLENSSGWVTRKQPEESTRDYPLGFRNAPKGLHDQLIYSTNLLSIGYYGWRDASILTLVFADGETLRLAPDLNAGTVAILYYFSRTTQNRAEWESALAEFGETYRALFGNPFDGQLDPLYYPDLEQPQMILPFSGGVRWAYTGGPHGAWEHDGARAALDFAPPTDIGGCAMSPYWTMAVAPGIVVRSYDAVVVIDLDGDGLEQTGWNVLYLHIAANGRVAVGARLEAGDPIGHPSCEGGIATGTHIHIARKFNGEWMLAGGPVPFNLSGWIARAGEKPYEGTLSRGGDVAVASPFGSFDTLVWR